MKRKLSCVLLFALSVSVMAWIFWRNAIPLGSEVFFYPNDVARNGEDFRLRMNEIDCLKSGVDPFKVWHGDIVHDRYYPAERTYVDDPRPGREGARNEPINAYPPWEYMYLYPLSCIDRGVAWYVYFGVRILAVLFLLWVGYAEGIRRFRSWDVGILFAALVIFQWLPSWYDVRIGNFGLLITAAIIGMALALRGRRDILAGVLFSFAMSKPQLSILLSIPLIIHRRFLALGVAAGVCLSGAGFSSFLCGVSPVTMILEAPSANVFAFSGCALMPSCLVGMLAQIGISNAVLMACSMLIGLGLCLILTWRLRDETDWFWILAPAVFMSAAWTYNQWHSYCPYALVALVMGVVLMSRASRTVKVLASVVIGISLRMDIVIARGLEICCCFVGFPLSLAAKLAFRDVMLIAAVVAFVIVVLEKGRSAGNE